MKIKLFTALVLAMLVLSACGTSGEKAGEEKKTGAGENKTTEDKGSETKKPSNELPEVAGYPQLTKEVADNERLVEMKTSMGTIKIKLFPEYAPKAVENFIKHSEKGYYDGLIFHRVIEDFMIQGGDPTGTGRGGESIYGKEFEDEFSEKLFNFRGALSMANTGYPSTNGSQFFIVQNTSLQEGLASQLESAGYPADIIKAYENGGTPGLDFKHTVFGQVIEGMDVVDKIAKTSTDSGDKPKKDVVIKKIKIIK